MQDNVEQRELHELVAAYALDALDDDDRRRFEQHLADCGQCADELASLREAAGALAYGVEPVPPPAGVRDRILGEIRDERADVRPLRRGYALPAAAALAAVAAVAAIGVGLWATSLSRSLDSERDARRAQERALAVVASADRRVPVAGGDATLALTPTGEAALIFSGLDRAPEGKAYEAWIVLGREPRPAGLFVGGGPNSVVVLNGRVPRGAIVGVTLEREQGVERPTGRMLFSARA